MSYIGGHKTDLKPINTIIYWPHSVQFSSVTQSCLTLCDAVNLSMPGLPVHHQLPEFTQIHVHRVSDAIQTNITGLTATITTYTKVSISYRE